MTLSLAFIAPPIVVAAIEGRLPRGFGSRRLMDLPMVWSHQWTALGLKFPTYFRADGLRVRDRQLLPRYRNTAQHIPLLFEREHRGNFGKRDCAARDWRALPAIERVQNQ